MRDQPRFVRMWKEQIAEEGKARIQKGIYLYHIRAGQYALKNENDDILAIYTSCTQAYRCLFGNT